MFANKNIVSVIIRTYNEEKYLKELLIAISNQYVEWCDIEIVIVDSGSTDTTLEIAKQYECRIAYINKKDFSFGRSLNIGCEYSDGDILVFISGHCIPTDNHWLDDLCKPIIDGTVSYSYGRQQGKDTTKYSEYLHFEKWFPEYSKLPQEDYFCNNANAALSRAVWNKYKFNEELSGLEDMYLAKLLLEDEQKIGYVSTASVYHIHDESWRQVKIRYEREAYALHQIMPEMHFSLSDFLHFFISSILSDFSSAIRGRVFLNKFSEIILFRFNHYWGTYRGNHELRRLSAERKKYYFYPKDLERDIYENSCTTANESK